MKRVVGISSPCYLDEQPDIWVISQTCDPGQCPHQRWLLTLLGCRVQTVFPWNECQKPHCLHQRYCKSVRRKGGCIFGGCPVVLLADIIEKNRNVIELYNLILKEAEHNQRTWYNSGIGTYAQPSWKSFKFYRQVLSHKIDLAIVWWVESSVYARARFTSCSFRNFEWTILAAYQWLSDNYQSGDCIYLFGILEHYIINPERCLGFSCGAYQVRVLSAMMDKVLFSVFRCL